MTLQAPFPYFGGKSTIAYKVWGYLGQPAHYIEPFFGSGAVLLSRQGYDRTKHTETINDKDGYVANVWRALQFNPDEVARWCDWPVNHADLMARKNELLKNRDRLLENLVAEPGWYDPIMAGYWIWAASCWIGSGLTCPSQRPHIACKGKGVHKSGQIPHISNKGMGVHKQHNANLYEWFRRLSERLRYVRVVCGDWSRVCGGNWQDKIWPTVGIYFDPPYGVEDRDGVYDTDDYLVSTKVREWSIERGKLPSYRIVVSGYEEEHEELLSHGWTKEKWKAVGGYGNQGDGQGKTNRHREALFISPHCITQRNLFNLPA